MDQKKAGRRHFLVCLFRGLFVSLAIGVILLKLDVNIGDNPFWSAAYMMPGLMTAMWLRGDLD